MLTLMYCSCFVLAECKKLEWMIVIDFDKNLTHQASLNFEIDQNSSKWRIHYHKTKGHLEDMLHLKNYNV